MITVKDLVKNYNGRRAVDQVSFTVNKGEIFGLLGPNGAGKTTILRIMSTILKADKGEVFIGGFSGRERPDMVRKIIGVCPQEIALYPDLTCRENMVYFGVIGGLSRKKALKSSEEILREVKLEDRAEEKVSSLSGGMKRRLNLAVSLLNEPRVLFMDESTAGVDPRSREAIFNLLHQFKKGEITVVYSTHYMEEAERLCDRVAIMNAGRIIALDSPAALKRNLDPGGNISLEEVFLKLTEE
ncbi:MAG: ABC transporter ATP-binding protein [Candidatus Syntrophonatronum acetioxidans]|uniref:ABC transporter ATP-binding protein n=1 Tax=Candidatus Syntrophonatronum acetioxidans TaxID=1795816 RepID=A0A424YHA8_9FIRM|nr:MAG: ABC transporter ATP-binding protein [Candidatus Syntrophonatronum acetioxidans]